MKIQHRNLRFSILPVVLASVFFLFFACRKENPVTDPVPGVTYEYIKTYDLPKLNNILNAELERYLAASTMHFSDFQGQLAVPEYPVKLYRVVYPSVIPERNRPTMASGLVAIPDNGSDSMPVISYQHGTIASRYYCPSIPDSSMEIRLMIAQFASQGYIVIAPDYFGSGISTEPNAYFIKGSNDQACMDMLSASKQVCKELKVKQGSLFLHGFSQGGHSSMSFLRELESRNIPVKAAATAAGCADIFATYNRWINNPQPDDATFLPGSVSNLIFAMEYYYQMPGLSASAILPKYYQASTELYQWKMDWTTFLTTTSTKVSDILQPGFMGAANPVNKQFWQILDQNEAYRWHCQTPLTLYYGEADPVLSVFLATLAVDYQNQIGCSATVSETAGPLADHGATYVYSLIHAKSWFDGF